jgi:hypothetical protein
MHDMSLTIIFLLQPTNQPLLIIIHHLTCCPLP